MPPARTYNDAAVVIRTYKLGESDRIVVLMTAENGKVRAVGKGARKTMSRFGSRLEPTAHIAVQLHRGRGELQTVTQAKSLSTFENIRHDLDRIMVASSLLEVVDHFSLDNEPNEPVYHMLVRALATLNESYSPLLRAGFFWKLLAMEGYAPVLDSCTGCGGTQELSWFDLSTGGVRCENCHKGRRLSAEAVETIRMILDGRLAEALALPDSTRTRQVDAVATAAMEYQLERPLKSIATEAERG